MRYLMYFIVLSTVCLTKGKNEDQTKVETEMYNEIECVIVDLCRECSYSELK